MANLTALRSLDLSDNRLTSLPSLLAAQQVFLEAIDLSANDFNHIPMVLKNMRRLRVINLSYNDALQVITLVLFCPCCPWRCCTISFFPFLVVAIVVVVIVRDSFNASFFPLGTHRQ